ncbi:MAG: HK97 family phage prohead protease [Vicinamibacterales bacterium]
MRVASLELPPVFGLASRCGYTMPRDGGGAIVDARGTWQGIEHLAHEVQLQVDHGGQATAWCSTTAAELQLFEDEGDLYFAVDIEHSGRARDLQRQVRAGRFSGVSIHYDPRLAEAATWRSNAGQALEVLTSCAVALREISLICAPKAPRCRDTWVSTFDDPRALERLPAGSPLRTWRSVAGPARKTRALVLREFLGHSAA